MSVISDFVIWYTELQQAVQEALGGPMKDGLLQEISENAQSRVYEVGKGYGRGKLGAEENMWVEQNGFELHVRNVTIQQGGPCTATETGFVEEGLPAYHQPFPRPFMDEALVAYAYGKGPDDLADALRSRGFTVN